MEQANKILFWFRESLQLDSCGLCNAVIESSEIIPVFCFDPRETELVRNFPGGSGIVQQQIQSVKSLRQELKARGSNLLVVGDPYEKIIPSLARVLNINKVVTNWLPEPMHTELPELTSFRNKKTLEIRNLLQMHSIPMVIEDQPASHQFVLPASFPRFPEINPGVIPPPR
jgi:deoxyribodipyrimidine photolyase